MNDLLPTSGLDQSSPTNNRWMVVVDDEIQKAIDAKDPQIIFNAIQTIKETAKIMGLALAKILYTTYANWDMFSEYDDFYDRTFEGTGYHKHTIERYVKVWAMFEEGYIPEKLEDEFAQKNIKDLIPIANALHQGYEIKNKQWKKLSGKPDEPSIREFINEKIKKVKSRRNALTLVVNRDGEVTARMDDEIETVLWFDMDNKSDLAEKARQRIMKNSGMVET